MGMHAMIEDQQQAKLAAAVQAANQWAVAATPLVKALFLLEDADSECGRGCDARTYAEVKPILGKPQKELREMLVGLRDNFLADQMPAQPAADAPESAWDERDAWQDVLHGDVTSVDALIKRMVAEA